MLENVLMLIGAILGAGGVSAIVVAIMNKSKTKSEATVNESEAGKIKMETEKMQQQMQQDMMKFLSDKLVRIQEQHKVELESLINSHEKKMEKLQIAYEKDLERTATRNNELMTEIKGLKSDIGEIIKWVFGANLKYRHWLESELRAVRPDCKIPECEPPPAAFKKYMKEFESTTEEI